MKRVEIIKDGVQFLQRFDPNETYVAQKRAVQSNPHDASEYTSVWTSEPKSFDLITARGNHGHYSQAESGCNAG